MFPPDFNSQLTTALLDWLWRSWISFGISGHGTEPRQDRVIDPEALLLASSQWARFDARLFDEILDWLCQFGHLIHLQRLLNMRRSGLGDPMVLSAIAAVLLEHSPQAKWKTLVTKTDLALTLEPLFLSLEGEAAFWGQADPLFAQHGFQRGRMELRQLGQPPDPGRAANLWLKLRALFGTSARAEILLHLLTTGPATATEIARRSGYTTRSILLPLREMALSGHLSEPPRPTRSRPQRGIPAQARTRGPSLPYSLNPEEWHFLCTWEQPSGFPILESPVPLLRLCQTALQSNRSSEMASPGLQALQLREAAADHLAEIHRLGLSGTYGLPPDLTGERLASTLTERLPALIEKL